VDDGIDMRLVEERHGEALFYIVEANRERLGPWEDWQDGIDSVVSGREFARQRLEGFAKGDNLATGIWFDGNLIGGIGANLDKVNRRAELAYWLAADHQGHGTMTKCCKALITYLFTQLGFNRAEIRIAPSNTRSRGVPERLGFRQETTLRQARRIRGYYVDHVVYGMLASEWVP
jgi:ribosomal-protein-serine acetyltransferase